jgi:hypothetical protein
MSKFPTLHLRVQGLAHQDAVPRSAVLPVTLLAPCFLKCLLLFAVCCLFVCRDSHTKTLYRALQCFLYDFWGQKECKISTDPQ